MTIIEQRTMESICSLPRQMDRIADALERLAAARDYRESQKGRGRGMTIRDLQRAIQSAIDEAPGVCDDAEVAVRDGKIGCITTNGEFFVLGDVC